MILYHGSNQLITRIDLSKSKDFGRGFYPLTSSSVLLPTRV